MKKLKALLCIVLVLATAFGFSGCFKSSKNFVTPMHNGKELTSKDFNEVTIVEWNSIDDTTISATIDVKALGCDITALYSYRCALGKDKNKASDDDYIFYDKTYGIEVDQIEYLYYDEDADEVIEDGISFFCSDYRVEAIKEFDSNDQLGVLVEANYDSETQTLDQVKKEILKIFDNITVDDDTDEDAATVSKIDALKFNNGWYVKDVGDVDIFNDGVNFTWLDSDENRVYFSVDSCSKETFESFSEDDGYHDNFEKATNEKGKEVGTLMYDDDSSYCVYYIDCGSGNYSRIMVSNYSDECDIDIYSWSDIESILNNGNDK